jgi:hypothetical protein
MSKIHNYGDFLNEEFFKKIFGRKKPKIQSKSNIDICIEEIIKFLNDNKIYTWDDFIYSKKTDKYTINKIIDGYANNMRELEEIRFILKLELSNRNQLKEYLKELEQNEDYEKCAQVLKMMSIK